MLAYIFLFIIFINCLPVLSWSGKGVQTGKENTGMVIDFTDPDQHKDWRIINDGVMGGISQSEMIADDSTTAIFQGNVSLENNGGFASVRVPISLNLSGYTGVELRIRGDGAKYQFRIRVDNRFDGISYRNIFETNAEEWQIIRLPFVDFVPVFRGRIMDNAGPLSPEKIQQLGFLIADKQEGRFRLEIDWIKSYK
jgi:hypothetical protein